MATRRGRKKEKSNNAVVSTAIRQCKGALMAVVVFSFFINLLTLAIPVFMLQLYDRVLPSRSVDTLLVLTVIVLIALLTSAALDAVRATLLTRIGAWLEQRLSPLVMFGMIENARDGETRTATGLRELASLRGFISGSSLTPILDAPWTPIFIVVLYALHPLIGTITLIGAVVLLSLAFANEYSTRKIAMESGDSAHRVTEDADAIIRNSEAISAMGMRRNVIDIWQVDNVRALTAKETVTKRGRLMSSTAKFARYVVQITVMCCAAWLIMNGQLSGGALMASILLMRRAIAPMEGAIRSWKSVQSFRHSLARVDKNLGRLDQTYPTLQRPQTRLDLSDVRYYHPDASKPVLRKVNLEVAAGEAVAIVGATGAGKSTLARLIVGNIKPSRGHVRLDDNEVTDWDPEELGPYVGYLPQEVTLFKGGIGQNIARMSDIGKQRVRDAVVEAAEMADAHEMIIGLPEGFDTPVGTDGVRLSGGQRQRVGLARAVFNKPLLIVLDEPDAHLDHAGRKALSSTIKRLKEANCIVVMITHQVRIPEHVDRIVRVRNGKVEAVNDDTDPKPSRSTINDKSSSSSRPRSR